MDVLIDLNSRRTEDEWRRLLADLLASLAEHLGHVVHATSWNVWDDEPDRDYFDNGVEFRGVVNAALSLEVCGVLCVGVALGSDAWVECYILLFGRGRRIRGSRWSEIVTLKYDGHGWIGGWDVDEHYEWASYDENSRWRTDSPGTGG